MDLPSTFHQILGKMAHNVLVINDEPPSGGEAFIILLSAGFDY
jgi:hypothetical protein